MRNDKPDTRLDRIARDLSRTWLHGSRSTASGPNRPATVMTGQQIPVDIPVIGNLSFEFDAPGTAAATVVVSNADARNSLAFMTSAIGPNKSVYLTLAADINVPTWTFAQRQFSLPDPQPQEDRIDLDLGGRPTTVAKLPVAAIQECGGVSDKSFVSLWSRRASSDVSAVPRTSWQPALLLRLSLSPITTPAGLPPGMSAFTLGGIPQSDRFFLDQLGLLASVLPGRPAADPPRVSQVVLHLERGDKSRVRLSDWTVVRTNLTREARSQPQLAAPEMAAPMALPYVAAAGQDEDALRLFQMGSITNSGGYVLRATADPTGVETLVITVLLQTVADTSDEPESAWLPTGANAVAWTGATSPDSIRFNGLEHIQVKPATPTGVVAFGWTRTEPADDQMLTDEQKFGFGTISLLEYSVSDGASNLLQPMESCIAISPSDPLDGDWFGPAPDNKPEAASMDIDPPPANAAAMRMLAPHHVASRRAASLQGAAAQTSKVNHFHGTFDCRGGGANKYWRIGEEAQRHIYFAAGLRDVFGNRFATASAPVIVRKLFYTDALSPPAEWPGLQFGLYSLMKAGRPCLALECSYHFLAPRTDQGQPGSSTQGGTPSAQETNRKQARVNALGDLYAQLQGVKQDVSVTLDASPLRAHPVDIDVSTLLKLIQDRMRLEAANTDPNAAPVVETLQIFDCDGSVSMITSFAPKLRVRRTIPDYCPTSSDLPSDATLAGIIHSQVTEASSPVALQVRSFAGQTPAPADGSDADFRSVAAKFQLVISAPLQAQVALLRDRFNVHQLYLIPNGVLPEAPAPGTHVSWSMATPRPLATTLGSDAFQLPDFGTRDDTGWNGHSISTDKKLFVDQDLDLLARSAFSLIERESTDLSVVGITDNADQARTLFQVRESLSSTLSSFAASGDGSYLVPLFADAATTDFDGKALRRAALDSFRADLGAFYALGTCLQLPLKDDDPVNADIQALEGSVEVVARNGEPAPLVPIVSDLLLHAGQSKATVLYSLPPSATGWDAVKSIGTLRATFKHLQLKPASAARVADDENVFSQGPWLELAQPYVLEWTGPPEAIPVVDRMFPQKPTLQSNDVLTPWTDAQSGEVAPPQKIDKAGVSSLIRWAWSISFAISNMGEYADTIHAQIQYNVPSTMPSTSKLKSAGGVGWKPETPLQALVVLKSLLDNWASLPAKNRLACLNDLGSSLADLLGARVGALDIPAAVASRGDFFVLSPGRNVAVDRDGVSIMKGDTTATWKPNGAFDVCTWLASFSDARNAAFLTGAGRVRNYRVSLLLRRNETFGRTNPRDANPLLIYKCVPVTSPIEVWASNRWVKPIEFDPAGQMLQDALNSFFEALLRDSQNDVRVEVTSSLAWSKGGLTGATPLSILPSDFEAQSGLADSVAAGVYQSCREVLGIAPSKPKEVDKASLRLKVKVSESDAHQPAMIRTLVEITQIDFPLD
jgi:hypothetical protein